jgi:hypothetical protein
MVAVRTSETSAYFNETLIALIMGAVRTSETSIYFKETLIALIKRTVRIPETSAYFNKTTRRYIPEGCNLRLCKL